MEKRRSGLRAAIAVCVGLAAGGAEMRAQTPVSVSPDVTLELDEAGGGVFRDEDVAVDDGMGSVGAAPLGALPAASDVSGYAVLDGGDRLLCFDTTVTLPGPLVASPGDVVRYDGATYAVEFDASANGVATGVRCDAVAQDISGRLLLSFDVGVALPGGVRADDEDVVRVEGPSSYALVFDGTAEGVPGSLDVDGAHRLANGNLAVSFDVGGVVGGVAFQDEDVLEYDVATSTWSLAFAGSGQDADWGPADVDAVALPEAGQMLLLAAGLGALALLRARTKG